jgi:hypothetical protein
VTSGATFVLSNGYARREATRAIFRAAEGMVVEVREPKRSLSQNDRLHAMIGDLIKGGFDHKGRKLTMQQLKVLFVSTWQIETGQGSDIIEGLSGEAVQLVRGTSELDSKECSEVMIIIERTAAERGIALKDDA